MKEATVPLQRNNFFTRLLEFLTKDGKPSKKRGPGKDLTPVRRKREERKDFIYYIRLINSDTMDIVGHLSDISSDGFKLDTREKIPIKKDFRFIMNLTSSVADKPFMKFMARSRWCRIDPLDPFVYNVGFQLTHIALEDLEIFNRMIEEYGREPGKSNINLSRSNKW